MEVIMRADTSNGKDLTGMQKNGRAAWYVVGAICMVALSVTACASPTKRINQANDLMASGQYSEGVAILEPMAEEGNYSAQFSLAFHYHNKTMDHAKKVYWLLKVVENPAFKRERDGFFLGLLGDSYAAGKGVAKDLRQACVFYKRHSEIRESFGASFSRDQVDKCTSAGMFK